jgi:hypothetical protein
MTVVCLATWTCRNGTAPTSDYLPPQLDGTVVGEIVEIGEGLTPLGHRPGVIDMLVEKRPLATAGTCPSIFLSVRAETQIAVWRRAEEIRAGTAADLEVGATVRAQMTEEACFGSCQGPCGAVVVQVFVE